MNGAHAFARMASTGSIRAAFRAGAKPASNPEATATLSAITIREGRTFSSMPTSSALTSNTTAFNRQQRKQCTKQAQRDRFEQKLGQDKGGFRTDCFLNSNDAGALPDTHKHDVGNAKATHEDSKDPNEPTPPFHLNENRVQNRGQHSNLVDRESHPHPADANAEST